MLKQLYIQAKKIVLPASGENKTSTDAEAVKGPSTVAVTQPPSLRSTLMISST